MAKLLLGEVTAYVCIAVYKITVVKIILILINICIQNMIELSVHLFAHTTL